ncbi:MAG: NAD(P)/FAD-dependent oxidoreductase [Actinobacteria bacterium]|nr:NAD(P)/FAD-dependent oxidoreductase [Actinomycetota bacterium]
MGSNDVTLDTDVIVVGAGMSGLYALKVLRERGFRVIVLERAAGVGGTWFWNRYPGARCDIPSLEYSFGFDPELEQEWEWSEHFAAQPEIERYLNHVADRYNLRPDIRLETGVAAMTFDEKTDTWVFDTETGEQLRSRFCVMGTGGLSAPHRPDWPGIDTFAGDIVQTSLWPEEGVALEGRRVGIVGNGSSGVQAIPELAKLAGHLTVFQRTAAFTWPSQNKPLTDKEQAKIKSRYRELRAQQYASPLATANTTGAVIFTIADPNKRILESTPEEREAALAEHGFSAARIWADSAKDLDANAMAVELFREMVRRTINDPELADSLSPKDYPIGCKRPVLDNGYFETFNRDDVTLVDLRKDPIVEVVPEGVVTSTGLQELDVLVFATGFDAVSGALTRIDMRGNSGRLLRDEWADGPRTFMGFAVADFPNMFMIIGPGSVGVLATYPPHIELQVGWIADFLDYLAANEKTHVEVESDAQEGWCAEVEAAAVGSMFTAPSCNSWYNGGNIEGKARVLPIYLGGLDRFMARARDLAANDYEGFSIH